MAHKQFKLVTGGDFEETTDRNAVIFNECTDAAIKAISEEDFHYAKDCLRQLAGWFKGSGAHVNEFVSLARSIESWGVSKIPDTIQREKVRRDWREFWHMDKMFREYGDSQADKVIILPSKKTLQ